MPVMVVRNSIIQTPRQSEAANSPEVRIAEIGPQPDLSSFARRQFPLTKEGAIEQSATLNNPQNKYN